MFKHKKIETFFKRKTSDQDENYIASTSSLQKHPSNDHIV